MAVLLIPLSLITWVPGAILWSMQAGLEGGGWGWKPSSAERMFLGSLLWILLLSLLGLALSAWVRWKVLASALLFGIFFITDRTGEIVNKVLVTKLWLSSKSRTSDRCDLGQDAGRPANKTLLGELFNVRQSRRCSAVGGLDDDGADVRSLCLAARTANCAPAR